MGKYVSGSLSKLHFGEQAVNWKCILMMSYESFDEKNIDLLLNTIVIF